jgi:hypothetical protein
MAGLKRLAVLCGVVAAAPALALLGQAALAPAPAARPASQDAYLRLLNAVFIRNNWLVSNPGGKPVVDLSPEARATPEALDFYNGSPLKKDLSRDDPNLWRIVNGVVVEMTPFAHYQPPPFQPKTVWRGALRYRLDAGARPGAEIVSATGSFRLTPRIAGASPKPLVAAPQVDAFRDPLAGEGDTLELWAGDPAAEDAPLVRLVLAGDTPLVRVTGRSGTVTLDGRVLHLGETGAFAAGAQLALRRGRSVQTFVSRGAAAEAVSWSQPLADRWRAPGLDRFARHIEAAMTAAVAHGLPADRDLRLSLDAGLQAKLQRQFADYCRGHGRFRAAMTVMDAETGEVLALVSWPGEGADGDPAASQDRGDLERNQNFYRMPIGSAAKVPISAALLTEHPALRTLQVRGRPGAVEITDLMGLELSPIQDEAVGLGGWIGFDDFLKYSSNRYATALMVLGAAPRPEDAQGSPTGADTYRLSGTERSRLPALPFAERPGDQGIRLGALESKLGWPGRLHDLFGIDYEAPRTGARPDDFGDDSSDLGPWRGLLCDPGLNASARAAMLGALRDVSPDREVFATNRIASFRSDYAPIILGGQAWGWTNLRLAEAFARIVTGKAVEPTLLQGPATCAPQAPLPLPPEVRQTLMHAMARVTEPGGTAQALRPGLVELQALAPAGETIGLWGKTGTPSLELPRLTPRDLAENDLIRDHLLQLQNDKVVLVLGGRITPADVGGAAGALARDPAARGVLAKYGVTADSLLARGRRFNREHASGLYDIKNGMLARVQGASGLSKQHDPKIFAFVVGRYAGAPGEGPPRRALAVAINIEERWLPTNEAVMFARCVLPSTLAAVLFDNPARTRAMDPDCKRLGLS